MDVGTEKILILKRKNHSSPVTQIIPSEQYYDFILRYHKSTGHGGRGKFVYAFKEKYIILVPAINIYLKLCKTQVRNLSQKLVS